MVSGEEATILGAIVRGAVVWGMRAIYLWGNCPAPNIAYASVLRLARQFVYPGTKVG